MGSDLSECEFSMDPKAQRSGSTWTVLIWKVLPTFIFCRAARGLSCGLMETSVDLIFFILRGKKFLITYGSAWAGECWRTPPGSTVGTHVLQGSQRQMGEKKARLFLGSRGRRWLPWEWDSLPKSDAEASLRDHRLPQMEEVVVRS